MEQKKIDIVKHLIFASLLILAVLFDFIYRSLFKNSYNWQLSLLIVSSLIAVLIVFYHNLFIKPYSKVIIQIHKHYEEILGDMAVTVDLTDEHFKTLTMDQQFDNLEQLLCYYKAAQQKQSALVCQLTNKNNILDQNNRFANAIVQITNKILHSGDIHDILQLILNKAIEIIPNAQKGSILLFDGEYMRFKAMYGYDMEALEDFSFELDEIYQSKAENLHEPIIIHDVENYNQELDPDKYDTLKTTKSFELKCSMSCAIFLDDQFYGTINIDNTESNDAFVDDHKPIIKYFAEQIGIALKNAQLINKILQLSHYDSLTGICNRGYFEEQLNMVYETASATNQEFSLVTIDLNDLKYTNDTYGHEAGDRLIVTFTDYMKKLNEKPDFIGRIGGDEFALVYSGKSKEEITAIMTEIKTHFANAQFHYNSEHSIYITFGFGICTYPHEARDIPSLMKIADARMYEEKRRSKELSQWNHNSKFTL